MLKKLNSYNLPNLTSTVPIKAGEFEVSKGMNATCMRLKVTCQLTNSGTARPLTDAERAAFLSSVMDHTLKWGAGQQHKPRSKVSMQRERLFVRQMLGSELEGYNDSATGLARSIGSTATTVQWWQRIYLTGANKDPATNALFGVGPTQAKTITVDLRRGNPTLPTNFAMSGAVTVDLYADEFPSKYDRVCPIPIWYEFQEANKVAKFQTGLTLYACELSAPHAASVLSDVTFAIDGLTLYEKVSVQDVISVWLDTPNYWSENQTFDAETVLHQLLPGQLIRDWPTGMPTLTQETKTLPTGNYGQLFVPVMTEDEIKKDVALFAASKGRRISGVSLPVMLGTRLPDNIRFAMPYALLDEDDSEFDAYPGIVCEPKSDPALYFPAGVSAKAKALVELNESVREYRTAEKMRKELASSIPGAVQDARGWGRGSSAFLEAARVVLKR